MANDDERVEIKLDLKHQTKDAWLASDGTNSAWLPRSKCGYDGEFFYIPEWLAKEKGFI